VVPVAAGLTLAVGSVVVPGAQRAASAPPATARLAAASAPPATARLAAASSSCPAAATCVTMPPSSNPAIHTGTVEALPTADLGPNQWVYLSFTGFTPGVDLLVDYCADTPLQPAGPGQTGPICDESGTPILDPQYTLYTFGGTGPTAGTASVSFQVAEDQSPNPPISGAGPPYGGPAGTFYCDGTSANPCSIDVTEPALSGGNKLANPDNTVVIPISFAPATNGCPGADLVNTESEFGIEQLLTQSDRLACASSHTPSLAFNTAQDGLSAVTALAQGNVQVAFTDDPEAADQQQQLRSGHFALIPVALTADVVAFRATMGAGTTYSQTSLDVTPTQVAGLVTNDYTGPTESDMVTCTTLGKGLCTDSLPCTTVKPVRCSLLGELNGVPNFIGAGTWFLGASQYGSYVRSDASGTTDQLFAWICGSSGLPTTLTVNGAAVSEPVTGAQELMAGLNAGLSAGTTPYSTCPVTDTFPPLNKSTSGFFAEVNSPNQQLVKLGATVVPAGVGSTPDAGFMPMNWAEADYYGLDAADLQDAAGQFVGPSAASIDAALADATTNADGSLTPSYTNTTDAAAYAMPSVIYAAVPTDPLPESQATAVRQMLGSLLNLTGGSDDAGLPSGFVPLTPALYAAAQKDLTKDITGLAPVPTPPSPGAGGSGSAPPPGSSGTGTGAGTSSSFTPTPLMFGADGTDGLSGGSSTGAFARGSSFVNPLAGAVAAGARSGTRPPAVHRVRLDPFLASGALPPGFLLAASADRLLLPVAVGLGLLVLGWGLLLLSPRFRRRVLQLAGAGAARARRIRGPERPGADG
jgi:hypothetical protein